MKPAPFKNYGSIGHLPGSRLGPGDHSISEGQAKILTDKPRDYKDLIIVQEKLDGANVGILRTEEGLVALTRKGHRAIDSPTEQFQMFAKYVRDNSKIFERTLELGERLIGEWIAMAHGTRYKVEEPFIAFDIMKDVERIPYINFRTRCGNSIKTAKLLHMGQPLSIKRAQKLLDIKNGEVYGYHGALEPVEGAVWRCEREGKVDFLGKYVRQFKEDGKYFNEDHTKLIWNWKN